MRRYRRRLRPGPWLLWPALLGCMAGLSLMLMDRALGPNVLALAEMKARAEAQALVNRVVVDEVGRGLAYGNLVTYRTDRDGRVTMVEVNTPAVNAVTARAVAVLERELRALDGVAYRVPLGQAMGRSFLVGMGPLVPVRLYPVGAVTAGVAQRFDEAGINQTRHTVLLQIRTEVRILAPLTSRQVEVQAEFPLAEGIIVGPVPQQYWRGDVPRITPGP